MVSMEDRFDDRKCEGRTLECDRDLAQLRDEDGPML
jgi:hypothetical protein